MGHAVRCLIAFALAFCHFSAFAAQGPQTFTLDGQLKQAGTTTALLDSNVQIEIQILDPSLKCVLYSELQTVNTQSSNGYFNIQVGSVVGSGKRVAGVDPGLTMANVFANNVAKIATDADGQTCPASLYTPIARDIRYLRLKVTPSTIGSTDTLADIVMDAVPAAMVAEDSDTVGGFGPAQLLRVNTTGTEVLTQANVENIFDNANYTKLVSLLAGTSSLYDKPASNGTSVLPNISGPASPAAGQIWYDGGQIKYYDGTTTQVVTTGSGSQWTTSGSDIYYNTGKVGIGTATPSYKLDVAGNAALGVTGAGGILALRRPDDGTAQASIGWGSAGTSTTDLAIRNVGAGGVITFTTDNGSVAERVRVDNNGNVGIGTAAPARLLHVAGPIRVNPSALPGSPAAGDLAFDSGASNALKYYDGTSWQTVGIAGTGISALTGDVTASGSGSVAATIANKAVTYAKIQDVTSGKLLGRSTAGAGSAEELTVGSNLALSAGTLDVGSNVALKNGANAFTNTNSVTVATTTKTALVLKSSDDNLTKNIFEAQDSTGAVKASIAANGVPAASTDLTTKAYVDSVTGANTAVSNSATLNNGKVWIGDGSNKAQEQSLSGDVTINNTGIATVANDAITFAKMANMNTAKIIGRTTAAAGDPEEISVSSNLVLSAGTLDVGSNVPLKNTSNAFTGTLATTGSLRVGDGSEACAAGFTGGIRYNGGNLQFCDGSAWTTLGVAGAGITALTGDVTASGSGSVAATIANNSVTFAKMADMNTGKIIGRTTAAAGDPEEIGVSSNLALSAGTLDVGSNVPLKNAANAFTAANTITVPTTTANALVLKSSDDNTTKNVFETLSSTGTVKTSIAADGTPAAATDLTTKSYVDALAGNYLLKSGGTMTGAITTAANGIILTPGALAGTTAGTLAIDSGASNALKYYDGSSWKTVVTGTGVGDILNGGNTTGAEVVIGTNDAQKLSFETGDTKAMTIDTSGNVGIGTTAPTAKLEVTGGDVKINTLTVGLGAGSRALNTALGVSALSSNTTGNNNTAIGHEALMSTTTTSFHTAIGQGALRVNNGTSNASVAVGSGALYNNTSGDRNTAIGTFALITSTTGGYNTGVGHRVMQGLTTGSNNVAMGYKAGENITTGSNNLVLGTSAGGPTTGSNNILLGTSVGAPSATADNQLNIGNLVFGSGMNGTLAAPAGNIGIGTTAPATKLEVSGTIRVGDGGETCGASYTGGIRYNGGNLQFCDGTSWVSLSSTTGTITALTGDVTASGTGSVTATIANNAVTFAKMADMNTGKIIGRTTASSGDPEEIGVSSNLSLSALTLDVGSNVPLKNASNAFTDANSVTIPTTTKTALVLKSSDNNLTKNIFETQSSTGVVKTSIPADGAPIAASDLTTKAYVDTSVGNYVLKAGDTMTGTLTLPANGLKVAAGALSGSPATGMIAIDSGASNALKYYDGSGWKTVFTGTAGTGDINNGGNTTGSAITIGTNDAKSLHLETNNTTAMTILSDGKVGIGTTSPSAAFEVVGGVTSRGDVGIQGVSGVNFGIAETVLRDASGAAYYAMAASPNGSFNIYNANAGQSPFYIENGFNGNSLYIQSTGNVGIGTTNPVASLDLSSKTDAISLPRGTTAQRPASPVNGMARYNTDLGRNEFYEGGQWVSYLTNINASAPSGTGGTGYLVLTESAWDGNLGGLAGANTKCRTELSTKNWKNKPGSLDTNKVFALLCDKSTCFTPQANINMYFAVANDTSVGGAGFSTDAGGAGPQDHYAYTAMDRFGPYGSTYWVGTRGWGGDDRFGGGPNSSYEDCSTWSSNSSSQYSATGIGSNTLSYRFSNYPSSYNETCSTPHKLICFVNP